MKARALSTCKCPFGKSYFNGLGVSEAFHSSVGMEPLLAKTVSAAAADG